MKSSWIKLWIPDDYLCPSHITMDRPFHPRIDITRSGAKMERKVQNRRDLYFQVGNSLVWFGAIREEKVQVKKYTKEKQKELKVQTIIGREHNEEENGFGMSQEEIRVAPLFIGSWLWTECRRNNFFLGHLARLDF